MSQNQDITVDFVVQQSASVWQLVLVEEGVWEPIEARLKLIQERLYGCLDATLDGLVAKKFPDTLGKDIVIRVDCYDAPKAEVAGFFERFSSGVFDLADYHEALANNKFARSVRFEINFDYIQ